MSRERSNSGEAKIGLAIGTSLFVAGSIFFADAIYSFTNINESSAAVEKHVEKLHPSFNHGRFASNDNILVNFGEDSQDQAAKGAKDIPVPEDVTAAGKYVRDNQQAEDLYSSLKGKSYYKSLIEAWGGAILGMIPGGVGSIVSIGVLLEEKKERRRLAESAIAK